MQTTDFSTVTFRELAKQVRVALKANVFQPFMLFGPPGEGKTSWCKHELRQILAEHHNIDIEDVGLVIEKPAESDAVDLAGMKLPKEAGPDDPSGVAEGDWYTENTVSPVIVKINKTGKDVGILLLDEAAQAMVPEQKALSSVFDPEEHCLGGHPLPRNWIVVATGNRTEDKSGSFKLLSHNLNRLLPQNVDIPVEDWVQDYCIPHNVCPVMVECAVAHKDDGWFVDAVPATQCAFTTKRSTVKAAEHLSAFMESDEFDGSVPRWMEKLLAANLGKANASRVVDYIHRRDKVPTAQEILSNPEGCLVPEDTGFQMVAANIGMAAVRDVHSAGAVLRYICRLRHEQQVPLGTKLMAKAAKQGWFIGGDAANKFIADFQQFLPLASEELRKTR